MSARAAGRLGWPSEPAAGEEGGLQPRHQPWSSSYHHPTGGPRRRRASVQELLDDQAEQHTAVCYHVKGMTSTSISAPGASERGRANSDLVRGTSVGFATRQSFNPPEKEGPTGIGLSGNDQQKGTKAPQAQKGGGKAHDAQPRKGVGPQTQTRSGSKLVNDSSKFQVDSAVQPHLGAIQVLRHVSDAAAWEATQAVPPQALEFDHLPMSGTINPAMVSPVGRESGDTIPSTLKASILPGPDSTSIPGPGAVATPPNPRAASARHVTSFCHPCPKEGLGQSPDHPTGWRDGPTRIHLGLDDLGCPVHGHQSHRRAEDAWPSILSLGRDATACGPALDPNAPAWGKCKVNSRSRRRPAVATVPSPVTTTATPDGRQDRHGLPATTPC